MSGRRADVAEPAADPADGRVLVDEPRQPRFVRSPVDLLRLLVALGLTLIGILFALAAKDVLRSLDLDVARLFGRLPDTLERFLVGLAGLLAVVTPIVVAVLLLILRRFRLLMMVVLAGALGAGLMWVVDQLVLTAAAPPLVQHVLQRPSWVVGAGFPDAAYLAGATAAATAAEPWCARAWRRTLVVTVAALALFRILSGTNLSGDVLIAIGVGVVAGSALLLALGARNRRPTGAAIAAAMARTGTPVRELHPAGVDARGSTPYFAVGTDGSPLFVKVLGQDERSADLLYRAYRFARLRDVGDERPFQSTRREVEHEALIALKAASDGIHTPILLAVADVDSDASLLSFRRIDGSSLDRVDDDALTDDVVRGIWAEVAGLRRHRIAHRNLKLANVVLDTDGRPWLVDFGFAELSAPDRLLNGDVAELLTSLALRIGPERAVATVVDVLGPDAVRDALPRIQLNGVSFGTRTAMAGRKPLMKDLQQAAAAAVGVEKIELEDLRRVRTKNVVTAVGLGLAFYFLIPQLANLPSLWQQVQHANWAWGFWSLVASLATYVGATMTVIGSVPDRIPAWPAFEAQLAGSFVNRITPAKVGGMATNIRFLQKRGMDSAVAISGIGLSHLAGFVTYIPLSVVFILWGRRAGVGSLHLPSGTAILVGLTAILALSGVVMLFPWGRKLFLGKLIPILRRSLHGVAEVAKQPMKVIALFGGSIFLTLTYIFALVFAIQAFGGGLPVATIGAVYLVGSAVATAAPTPGGIGAVEAALIAGLTAAGLDKTVAVPAVFLFRLTTFWLPVLPGWIALTVLERKDQL
ncbi:MAG TPA: lysylphosphatidylglycerol synthase transmembrane domain-containing protein [Actinomycetota bacterium]